MKAISFTEARNKLAATVERVCEDHDPVLITRKGEGAAVLMSLEDYESLEETAYLLRSPKNADRLLAARDQLNAGKGVERELVP